MLDWIIGIGIALAIGAVVGRIAWKKYDQVDGQMDDFQRSVNRLENLFARSEASWMAEVLEDIVVGDAEAGIIKIREMIEAPDTTLFFLDNIAIPCAVFAIRETVDKYPERFAKIQKAWPATVGAPLVKPEPTAPVPTPTTTPVA